MFDPFGTTWTVPPIRFLCPWDYPDNNIGVGYHFFLQGIFLMQGLSPCLLYWQVDSFPLSHQGNPPIYVCIRISILVIHNIFSPIISLFSIETNYSVFTMTHYKFWFLEHFLPVCQPYLDLLDCIPSLKH